MYIIEIYVLMKYYKKELNSSILFLQQKLPNCQTMAFFSFISYNVTGWLKKILKSDWLFCFTVPFSLDEKKFAI